MDRIYPPLPTDFRHGDRLVDINCATLDGKCDCKFEPGRTTSDDCKYLKAK